MSKRRALRLAILGAGPIGLEAALYARTLGLAVTVYEQGQVGEYVQRWGHVRLFSPFDMNSTPLGRRAVAAVCGASALPGAAELLTGWEYRARYLEPLARAPQLAECLRLHTRVEAVGRGDFLKEDIPGDPRRACSPFRLLLRDADGHEQLAEADAVLDCTGTYGQHRWLGAGGIPALGERAAAPAIAYGLEDIAGSRRSHYAGKTVLVVGSGYSAATSVCALADLAQEHPQTWVLWLARGARTQPLRRIPHDPLRERDRLACRANLLATRTEGHVTFQARTLIEAVDYRPDAGFTVRGRLAGRPHTWKADCLIANVGYTPDNHLYRELQVHECYATLGPMKWAATLFHHPSPDCLQQTCPGPDSLCNPEPNFFILGSKSFGRDSRFLLRLGFEQIRNVFRLLTGQPDLDLYQNETGA
jgi:thioredoxin reductase